MDLKARSIGTAMLIVLVALIASCTSAAPSMPVATGSPSVIPTPAKALSPVNDVAAQGSVRQAIASSEIVFRDDGDYLNLTAESMNVQAPGLRYGTTPSRAYNQVSFQVRGHDSLALAAMSPSGACFGALGNGDVFAYTNSGVGQTDCSAADVPYPSNGWNTRQVGSAP